MKKSFDDYLGVRRPRKVKHVKFFETYDIPELEAAINGFADEHPEYKILGVKVNQISDWDGLEGRNVYSLLATVTYLEDAKGFTYGDYEDDADEERDSD